ncbi:MAG: hypothetical protein HGA85_03560 [Nanoarchaeota archaeon]|nr:hypothetical protein [Nanoarchaeota archaeon]
MELKDKIILIAGVITTIIYILVSNSIKTTEYMWLLTRIFGILSFAALFATVVLGEIRLLSKVKADFALFTLHVPIAKMSIFLVLLHFISALFDEFKWGKYLTFTQYLGFSFSDRWLTLLSLGTIAFYLMLIVGLSSAKKSIQKIGYKRWKIVHYLSYLSFFIAYIHSVNLGTDLRHSQFSAILNPVFIVCFLFVLSLLIARIMSSFRLFEDQYEMTLSAVFCLVLVFGLIYNIVLHRDLEAKVREFETRKSMIEASIDELSRTNEILKNDTIELAQEQGDINGES